MKNFSSYNSKKNIDCVFYLFFENVNKILAYNVKYKNLFLQRPFFLRLIKIFAYGSTLKHTDITIFVFSFSRQ